jgi:hypothetical protein
VKIDIKMLSFFKKHTPVVPFQENHTEPQRSQCVSVNAVWPSCEQVFKAPPIHYKDEEENKVSSANIK